MNQPIPFSKTDFQTFKNTYQKKVSSPSHFQKFIQRCFFLIEEIKIEPEKVRFAITSKKEFMVLLGMRPIIIYGSKNNEDFLELIMNELSIKKYDENLLLDKEYTFKGDDNKCLVRIKADLINGTHLKLNLEASKEEYSSIKDSKRAGWNEEAATTNNSFKHIAYNNLNVEEFINQEHSFSEEIFNRTMSISKNQEYINVLKHKKQIILQGPPGTGKTRLAKEIAEELTASSIINKELNQSNHYEIIQFHPSYSYEDFVRGISIESNGKDLEYITKNRVLAKIAKKAFKNKVDSQKETSLITKEKWIEEQFELFKDSIIDKMDEEGKFKLNEAVNIIEVESDAFRYTGENNWSATRRMKFDDIILLFTIGIKERSEIKNQKDINALGRSHATYFKLVLDLFYSFMKGKKIPNELNSKVELKNYVLIIDEINRANLSSVLGELIYALEYRNEPVESMYTSEEDGNTIILPDNLYIIGTMNTADRSVGQIDYAIRRRFAFIDILPKNLQNDDLEEGYEFENEKFEEVKSIFEEFTSREFNVNEVQLGHSYFIHKAGNFQLKLKFEIKPILMEYINDGILSQKAHEKIEAL
jgi:MoxR-like ATPase